MEEIFVLPICGLISILGAVLLGVFGFWIWMLVDCAAREPEGSNKIAWILILIFVSPPIVGALIYLLARKLPRDRQASAGP